MKEAEHPKFTLENCQLSVEEGKIQIGVSL
jgi:hypothetical protein